MTQASIPRPEPETEIINAALREIERFDHFGFERVLRNAVLVLPPRHLAASVLFPLLTALGEKWENNHVSVAQEHMASQSILGMMAGLIQKTRPMPAKPPIVFATPQGERHEFGALLNYWLTLTENIPALYLGPDLPAAEIARAAAALNSPIIGLSAVMSSLPLSLHDQVAELRSLAGPMIEIWIGGSAAHRSASALGAIPRVHVADLPGFHARLLRRLEAEAGE